MKLPVDVLKMLASFKHYYSQGKLDNRFVSVDTEYYYYHDRSGLLCMRYSDRSAAADFPGSSTAYDTLRSESDTQLSHANVHWLILFTIEVDWPLLRDSY